jgi:hypothetical protein
VSRVSTLLAAMARKCDRPLQLALPLVALQIVWRGVPDDVPGMSAVEHTSSVLTIAAVTWLVAAALQGLADAMIALHRADVADNLQARRIQTQTRCSGGSRSAPSCSPVSPSS